MENRSLHCWWVHWDVCVCLSWKENYSDSRQPLISFYCYASATIGLVIVSTFLADEIQDWVQFIGTEEAGAIFITFERHTTIWLTWISALQITCGFNVTGCGKEVKVWHQSIMFRIWRRNGTDYLPMFFWFNVLAVNVLTRGEKYHWGCNYAGCVILHNRIAIISIYTWSLQLFW